MVSKKNRTELRQKKHYRLRHTLSGTSERPRLAVFRSNKHMYAQVIDDTKGVTLCSASTLDKEVKDGLTYTDNMEAAQKLGTVLGERAKAKGIEAVVFDRGGHLYAGKIQAFADSAREAGLKF